MVGGREVLYTAQEFRILAMVRIVKRGRWDIYKSLKRSG